MLGVSVSDRKFGTVLHGMPNSLPTTSAARGAADVGVAARYSACLGPMMRALWPYLTFWQIHGMF